MNNKINWLLSHLRQNRSYTPPIVIKECVHEDFNIFLKLFGDEFYYKCEVCDSKVKPTKFEAVNEQE